MRSGSVVLLQFCCGSVTVLLRFCYSAVTVLLRFYDSDVAVLLWFCCGAVSVCWLKDGNAPVRYLSLSQPELCLLSGGIRTTQTNWKGSATPEGVLNILSSNT